MDAQFEVPTDIATVCAAAASILAFIFAVYTHRQQRRSERRAAAFALHQMWSSPHLMDARGYAARICDDVLLGRMPLDAYASDERFIACVSQVEHFIVDLERLLSANVVCPELAQSLFSANVNGWIDRLDKTIYAAPRVHSFHSGKNAESAYKDFHTKLTPIRRHLKEQQTLRNGPSFRKWRHYFVDSPTILRALRRSSPNSSTASATSRSIDISHSET